MIRKILFVVTLFLLQAGPVCANLVQVGPASLYSQYQEEIISRPLSVIKGYVFSVGETEARKNSTFAKNIARKKAVAVAKSQFIELSVRDVKWPPAFSEKQKKHSIKTFLATHSIKLSLNSLTVVDEGSHSPGTYYSVIAVPEKSIEVEKVSFQQLNDIARAAVLSRKASPLIYYETCDPSEEQIILEIVAEYLEKKFGSNMGAMLHLRAIRDMPELWVTGKVLAADKIATLSLKDLFRFAEMNPYDPVALYHLGLNLKNDGHPKLASIFFKRGTLWFINEDYREKCLLELNSSKQSEPDNKFSTGKLHHLRNAYFGPLEEGKLSTLNPLEVKIIQSMGTIPFISSRKIATDFTTRKSSVEITSDFIPEDIYTKGVLMWKEFDEKSALPFFIQAYLSSGKDTLFKTKLEMLLKRMEQDSLLEEIDKLMVFING